MATVLCMAMHCYTISKRTKRGICIVPVRTTSTEEAYDCDCQCSGSHGEAVVLSDMFGMLAHL